MKFPRGVSGDRVIRALQQIGYVIVRQKGSHVRLQHPGPPVHSVTIPLHRPLKTGTLRGIVSEVALMRSIAEESLAELL